MERRPGITGLLHGDEILLQQTTLREDLFKIAKGFVRVNKERLLPVPEVQ